ncbi:hypothetical protein HanPSC8_Chr04g0183771 [Helianthus annuus]|nr:hypothetical protein HanPSC8_Chr04g0183771 [Helianthus annuus]
MSVLRRSVFSGYVVGGGGFEEGGEGGIEIVKVASCVEADVMLENCAMMASLGFVAGASSIVVSCVRG